MKNAVLLAALVAASASPTAAFADSSAGIAGYVIDMATNKPVPGAAVVIARLPVSSDESTLNDSVVADRKGFFSQLGLLPGTYAVTANVVGRSATCLIDNVYGGLVRSLRIYLSPTSAEMKCVHARPARSLVDPDQTSAIYTVH